MKLAIIVLVAAALAIISDRLNLRRAGSAIPTVVADRSRFADPDVDSVAVAAPRVQHDSEYR